MKALVVSCLLFGRLVVVGAVRADSSSLNSDALSTGVAQTSAEAEAMRGLQCKCADVTGKFGDGRSWSDTVKICKNMRSRLDERKAEFFFYNRDTSSAHDVMTCCALDGEWFVSFEEFNHPARRKCNADATADRVFFYNPGDRTYAGCAVKQLDGEELEVYFGFHFRLESGVLVMLFPAYVGRGSSSAQLTMTKLESESRPEHSCYAVPGAASTATTELTISNFWDQKLCSKEQLGRAAMDYNECTAGQAISAS